MTATTSELKPRDLGQIINETFRVYGQNFLPFLGIVAATEIPLIVIGATMGENPAVILTALFIAVTLVVSLARQGALLYALSDQYLGHRVSLGRSYQFVWPRLGTLLGAVLLIILVTAVLVITIIGIPFAIYLGVNWAFAPQGVVLEGRGVRAALSHSSTLVKDNWGRVLGILLAIGLILAGLNFIAVLILGLLSEVVAALATMVFIPIWAIGSTLLYYDLRLRREKYDLETMARELSL